MDAFGIFEGGGAKGLAHIGALKAAEENGVKFIGVAGTSVGAIVASLVAAGYTPDELFSPEQQNGVLAVDYREFLDEERWNELSGVKDEILALFEKHKGSFGCKFMLALCRFARRNKGSIEAFWGDLGFFDTSKFEGWLEEKLQAKLSAKREGFKPSGPDGKVAFRDLMMPLKVIASELTGRRIQVFPRPIGNEAVAPAVAASISLPIVFAPKRIDRGQLVDGGILSNFPAWVFDREREQSPPYTPIFGFHLVSKGDENKENAPGARDGNNDYSVMQFAKDLYHTAVFGDSLLETRAVASLNEIPLKVRVGTLDFDLRNQQKRDVYRDGQLDAAHYFRHKYVGVRDPENMKQILGLVRDAICREMGHHGHLRVNVMCPVDAGTLKIFFSFNMDTEDDHDDRIEFRKGQGACGYCWENLTHVISDLEDAKTSYASVWKMDKYQQRLVRDTLTSLLSVPIFDSTKIDDELDNSLEQAFLGVLNFDSDDRVVDEFREPRVLVRANECANLVAKMMTQR